MFAALQTLERARLVRRGPDGRYGVPDGRIDAGRRRARARPSRRRAANQPLVRHRGQWVAVERDLHASSPGSRDPRALVAEIRERGLRPCGIMRVPETDDVAAFEGAHGQ